MNREIKFRAWSKKDEDFRKAEKVNSNSQLYRQSGNSIVTSVLEAIFLQMNIKGCPTWEEYAKDKYINGGVN